MKLKKRGFSDEEKKKIQIKFVDGYISLSTTQLDQVKTGSLVLV